MPIVPEWNTLDYRRLTEMLVVDPGNPHMWGQGISLDPLTKAGYTAWCQVHAAFNLNQLLSSCHGELALRSRTLYDCLGLTKNKDIAGIYGIVDAVSVPLDGQSKPDILQHLLQHGVFIVVLSMFRTSTTNDVLCKAAMPGFGFGTCPLQDSFRIKLVDVLQHFLGIRILKFRRSVYHFILDDPVLLPEVCVLAKQGLDGAAVGLPLLTRLILAKQGLDGAVRDLFENRAIMRHMLDLFATCRMSASDPFFTSVAGPADCLKLNVQLLQFIVVTLRIGSLSALWTEALDDLFKELAQILIDNPLTKQQLEEADKANDLDKGLLSKALVISQALSAIVLCLDAVVTLPTAEAAKQQLLQIQRSSELQAAMSIARRYLQMTGDMEGWKGTPISQHQLLSSMHWASFDLTVFFEKGKRMSKTDRRRKRLLKSLDMDERIVWGIDLDFQKDEAPTPASCSNPSCLRRPALINSDELQKCTCGLVLYCGKVCQKDHWRQHKRICRLAIGLRQQPSMMTEDPRASMTGDRHYQAFRQLARPASVTEKFQRVYPAVLP